MTNTPIIDRLHIALSRSIALKLAAKQAHWNVRSPNFLTLHELFDTVASEVDGYADALAERSVQLGSVAIGRVQTYEPLLTQDAASLLTAITEQLHGLAAETRDSIPHTADAGDAVTADLFTRITAGLDKLHWFVDAHR